MGVVYGFLSNVMYYSPRPSAILFISYPKAVEILNLRTTQRVDCILPAVVNLIEGEYRGVILDISAKGCKFLLEAQLEQDLPPVQLEQPITISFQLVGIAETLLSEGTVRNLRQEPCCIELGIEFHDPDKDLLDRIDGYLQSILNYYSSPTEGLGL
jgi:hypothetical protein